METLQELTGHESGIVLYADDNGEITTGIIQNWSHEVGIPRISPWGTMMSWPCDIEVVNKKQLGKKAVAQLLDNLSELWNSSSDDDFALDKATLFELQSGDKVLVFDEWA